MNKVCFILGTRPEIIKLSPIIRVCKQRRIPFFILHTNQHYSAEMDSIFFDELDLPHPKYNLGIRESLHGKMVGCMLEGIEKILLKEKPSIVLVQGDTNTVLAGGLAAAKLQIKVGHVEAGLRSYDRTMPEEINRVVVDHLSDYLFCPTKKQKQILLGEGIDAKKIVVTGNTIVDAVLQNIGRAQKNKKYAHYTKKHYMLLTMHRPANVDDPRILRQLINAIYKISMKFHTKVLFPAHPRTRIALEKSHITLDKNFIELMHPVQFIEMLVLEKNAKLILTDSGGVQEEACILHVPCVTLRNNTERPETVDVGSNRVAGVTEKGIMRATLAMSKASRSWKNPFGNGKAAEKIVTFLR